MDLDENNNTKRPASGGDDKAHQPDWKRPRTSLDVDTPAVASAHPAASPTPPSATTGEPLTTGETDLPPIEDSTFIEDLLAVDLDYILRDLSACASKQQQSNNKSPSFVLTRAEAQCLLHIQHLARQLDSLVAATATVLEQRYRYQQFGNELVMTRRAGGTQQQQGGGTGDSAHHEAKDSPPPPNDRSSCPALLRPMLSLCFCLGEHLPSAALQQIQEQLTATTTQLVTASTTLRQFSEQNWNHSETMLSMLGNNAQQNEMVRMAMEKRRLSDVQEEVCRRIDSLLTRPSEGEKKQQADGTGSNSIFQQGHMVSMKEYIAQKLRQDAQEDEVKDDQQEASDQRNDETNEPGQDVAQEQQMEIQEERLKEEKVAQDEHVALSPAEQLPSPLPQQATGSSQQASSDEKQPPLQPGQSPLLSAEPATPFDRRTTRSASAAKSLPMSQPGDQQSQSSQGEQKENAPSQQSLPDEFATAGTPGGTTQPAPNSNTNASSVPSAASTPSSWCLSNTQNAAQVLSMLGSAAAPPASSQESSS